MKKFLFNVIALIAFTSASAQGLTIKGDIKNIPDNTVVTLLDGMANKEVSTDKVVGGKFNLKATTEFPGIFVVGFSGTGLAPNLAAVKLPLFLSNENLSITGDILSVATLNYAGSPTHSIYQNFMGALNPKMEAYFKSLQAVQVEKNQAIKDSIAQVGEKQSSDLINTYIALSKANSQSAVTTFFLFQFANIFPAVKDELGNFYEALGGDAKKGPFADVINKTLASAGFGKIGSVMPEFKQNDVNGKLVSLNSFRGKYVLVDFWASWCGPCRAENPNVVKAYNQYKDKNFTILSVSLDQDKAKWLEAIKKDGLNWTHVSDLKYWNNAVAVQFGIQSIPASFILDPNGKIIAKDLRGDALDSFLKSNLK